VWATRIGSGVGRKTSNCSRALHRAHQRVRVASRTVPLRWDASVWGAADRALGSSSLRERTSHR
jgi:hypothetical protein